MTYLLNNWWMVMDWFADETVTNWLSVGAGYVVGCVTLVTFTVLTSPLLWSKRFRMVTVGFVLGWVILLGLLSMFQVHTWLNMYQEWYTKPLNPPLSL